MKKKLILVLAMFGLSTCAVAGGFDLVEANVKVFIKNNTVEFTHGFWTNVTSKKPTYNIFPKETLRVGASKGEVILVIPDVAKSNSRALFFFLDDGENIRVIDHAQCSAEETFTKVFLFDINGDDQNEFIIFWADEGVFRIEAFSVVESEHQARMEKVFETPYMNYPRSKGVDLYSLTQGKLYIHYNYRGRDKEAMVLVNKDDLTSEPYFFPL